MKMVMAIVISSLLGVAATGLSAWYIANHKLIQVSDFKLTENRIIEDMQNRSVAIPPLGQLWAFTNDQNLSVIVLYKKPTEDGVIVYVRISSAAKIKDEKSNSINVNLNGVAKLHYELVYNEWFLADITSLSLQASQNNERPEHKGISPK